MHGDAVLIGRAARLVAMGTAVGIAMGTPGAARAADRCASAGSRTVASNDVARVLSKTRSPSRVKRYYGCDRRSGTKRFLGPRPSSDLTTYGVSRFRLSGSRVAFSSTVVEFRTRPIDIGIEVRDLRSGSRSRIAAFDPPGSALLPETEEEDGVSDIAFSGARLGWIVRNPYAQPKRTNEVYALRDGKRVLLASGNGIERASLTLQGCTLRWRDGGAARSSPLC